MLIVGLGNPGEAYEYTRHNAGYIILEYIAAYYNTQFSHITKFKSDIAKIYNRSSILLLAKPLTYMNCSGTAVVILKEFYKLSSSEIVIIHDDIDLPIGKVRLKVGGGDAGHNGLKSISTSIGSDYIRIRVGVGRPTPNSTHTSVSSYVLSRFSSTELSTIFDIRQKIAENFTLVLSKQFKQFIDKIK